MRILRYVWILVLAVCVGQLAAQTSAESVVADYFKALGGESKLQQIKSLYITGTTYTQSLPLAIRLYIVPPDKAYDELLMEDQVFSSGGTDGENAWQSTPLGTFFLEGDLKESARQQADFFPLLNYKKKGLQLSYLGEDLVKGRKSHKVMVVSPAGDTTYYYFAEKDHHLLKQQGRFGSVIFSKYRKVGDLELYHKLNTEGPDGEVLVTFDSIAVNVPVPDSLFVMPADAKPLPEKYKP